jgi:hypothetical protein
MSDIIDVKRKIYGKNTFTNVVDVDFNQLVTKNPTVVPNQDPTIETFFENYDTLFFDIPPSGSSNSHLELVTRSSEYIGISIENLQQEIATLRDENVSLKNQLFTLTNKVQ